MKSSQLLRLYLRPDDALSHVTNALKSFVQTVVLQTCEKNVRINIRFSNIDLKILHYRQEIGRLLQDPLLLGGWSTSQIQPPDRRRIKVTSNRVVNA
jgi:hypothetical protein